MAKKKIQVQGARIFYNTVHDSAAVAEGVHSFPIPQLYKMKRNAEIGIFTKPSKNSALYLAYRCKIQDTLKVNFRHFISF
jgi:hypothetical protein